MFNRSLNDDKKALVTRPPVRELMTSFKRSAIDITVRRPTLTGLACLTASSALLYGLGGTVFSALTLGIPAALGAAIAADSHYNEKKFAFLAAVGGTAAMLLVNLVYAASDNKQPSLTDIQKLSLNRIGAQVVIDKDNYKHTFRVVGAETTTQLADGKIIEFHKPLIDISNDTPHPLYRNKRLKTTDTLKLDARAGKMPDAAPTP